MWDTPSKQLFQKIMHPQLGLLSEYHLNVLIVAQSKQSIEVPIIWKYVETPDIPDESILHILRENGHAENLHRRYSRLCWKRYLAGSYGSKLLFHERRKR